MGELVLGVDVKSFNVICASSGILSCPFDKGTQSLAGVCSYFSFLDAKLSQVSTRSLLNHIWII